MINKRYPDTNLIPAFNNPIDAKSFISGMDIFIGARMHGTIAAYSSGVPCIATAYSPKFINLFKVFDYDYVVDLTLLDNDEFNGFLLTHPMRGATPRRAPVGRIRSISTHAPHARCDGCPPALDGGQCYFYSRTPCEVRPAQNMANATTQAFLLTHPMRGATSVTTYYFVLIVISTHAPHARCDPNAPERHQTHQFLLTHPMRGATYTTPDLYRCKLFLLTHPMRGATKLNTACKRVYADFYSRTPCEVRPPRTIIIS